MKQDFLFKLTNFNKLYEVVVNSNLLLVFFGGLRRHDFDRLGLGFRLLARFLVAHDSARRGLYNTRRGSAVRQPDSFWRGPGDISGGSA